MSSSPPPTQCHRFASARKGRGGEERRGEERRGEERRGEERRGEERGEKIHTEEGMGGEDENNRDIHTYVFHLLYMRACGAPPVC